MWLLSISEFARPIMQAFPRLVRFSTWPLFRLQFVGQVSSLPHKLRIYENTKVFLTDVVAVQPLICALKFFELNYLTWPLLYLTYFILACLSPIWDIFMAKPLSIPLAVLWSFVQSKLSVTISLIWNVGQRALCSGIAGFPIGGINILGPRSLPDYSYFIYDANKIHLVSFLANDRLGATSWRGTENS